MFRYDEGVFICISEPHFLDGSVMKGSILKKLIPERIPWFAVGLYAKIAGKSIHSYYEKIAQEIVAFQSHGKILDIGTGPGHLPIEIVKAAPDVRMVAIDLTKKMIELAQANATKAGVADKIEFSVGDGNYLDFRDESFDMVISTGSFHAWRNPARVINECHRVLKADGEAWIYDPAKVITQETKKILSGDLTGVDRLARVWASFTGKKMDDYTEQEIGEILEETLFNQCTVEFTEWVKITLKK